MEKFYLSYLPRWGIVFMDLLTVKLCVKINFSKAHVPHRLLKQTVGNASRSSILIPTCLHPQISLDFSAKSHRMRDSLLCLQVESTTSLTLHSWVTTFFFFKTLLNICWHLKKLKLERCHHFFSGYKTCFMICLIGCLV